MSTPDPQTTRPAGRSATWVAAALVAYLASVGNIRLWSALATGPDAVSWLALAALFLVLLVVFGLPLLTLAVPYLFKPLGVLLLLVTATTSSFMLDYGVLIDESMIRNALQTDAAETGELLTPRALLFVLLAGVLPAVALVRTRIAYGPPLRELARRVRLLAVVLTTALLAAWPSYKELASAGRNDPSLQLMVNPLTPLSALVAYARDARRHGPQALQPVAPDAWRRPAAAGSRPLTFVLVLGETATAGHFSLNGYARDTNPELRARDVLNFPQVTACGTSTADVLPCLFAAHAAGDDPSDRGEGRENLLDVLQRTGVSVLWRDNNSGCKDVCARVPYEEVHAPPALRNGPNPYDEMLLDGLQARLDATPGDLFLVLHQRGSHGPAYHRRTPPAFKRFLPECSDDDLQACAREDIVNAYDNTILYTDHVLGLLIDLLAANAPQRDVALLYVSDHGESLGENGVWLHGFPAWLAPEEQTHVPMVFWASPGFHAARFLDHAALQAASLRPYTHANLFHTVLGAFGVRTTAYDSSMDVLAGATHG